jgi:flagellar hook-associated protein 1 FlgK
MGLSQALSIAMAGLRANQAALSLVSSNVANAETPGYVRKSVSQVQTTSAGATSVLVTGVNRELDQYIQRQVLMETSGAAYASARSGMLQRLQGVYGDPSSGTTIESVFNDFTNALQALSTSPDSPSARNVVINAAQALTQQLNSTSQGIQSLRSDAESALNNSVQAANNAMQQIASINRQLMGVSGNDAASASLMDQRDQYVVELSQLMDIRVVQGDSNQISIFTNSGVQLVGNSEAASLSFNQQGTVTPNTLWNADPTKSNLGTITLSFPQGGSIDMVATNSIRSGAIAGYLELRDKTLVQAQAQIDQLAASLSSALSDKTTDGTPASSGTQSGYSFDFSPAQPQNGNVIHLTYTDTLSGQTRNLSIVMVNDPSVLPLKNTDTIDPNDDVIGVDFSGGMASVAAQLNAALGGSHLHFSGSGSSLTVLDDGGGLAAINAGSMTTTVDSLTGGDPQLALFKDGGALYTGALTSNGSQQVGLAGRITVNSGLLADPSRLIVYSTSPATPAGDTTRSDFILSQLTRGSYFYSPQTGIGSTATPFKGSLLGFIQQFTTAQGQAASAAKQLSDGQDVVLATLQNKMNASSGVNIDEEMAHLLALQNAYSANARVMSTANSMFAALLQSV